MAEEYTEENVEEFASNRAWELIILVQFEWCKAQAWLRDQGESDEQLRSEFIRALNSVTEILEANDERSNEEVMDELLKGLNAFIKDEAA